MNFWTFFTLGAFSLALFIGTVSAYQSEGLNHIWSTVSSWFNKIVMVVLFSLIYKLIPNCNVKMTRALLGGLFATILLTLAGNLFQAYIILFSNYEAIYGAALAALPTFLLWLYVIWIIVLLGAIVTWRTQQGFHFKKKGEEVNTVYPLPIANDLRFHLLQGCVILCCEKFLEGYGRGLTSEDIAGKIEVPRFWIEECLTYLEEKEIIIRNESDGGAFVRLPPDQMNQEYLNQCLGLKPQKGISEEFLRIRDLVQEMHQNSEQSIKSLIDPA